MIKNVAIENDIEYGIYYYLSYTIMELANTLCTVVGSAPGADNKVNKADIEEGKTAMEWRKEGPPYGSLTTKPPTLSMG